MEGMNISYMTSFILRLEHLEINFGFSFVAQSFCFEVVPLKDSFFFDKASGLTIQVFPPLLTNSVPDWAFIKHYNKQRLDSILE